MKKKSKSKPREMTRLELLNLAYEFQIKVVVSQGGTVIQTLYLNGEDCIDDGRRAGTMVKWLTGRVRSLIAERKAPRETVIFK